MSYYPTIRQIQYLLALYEFKNFRKAAESCFVTQPTLSAAMQELEQGLGVPVLDRSQRKKVVFTAFGLQVIEKSKEIMLLMDDLLSMAQNQAEPFSGVMRLGLIPTIAPFLLPVILPALQKKFPKMQFQITESMSTELVEKTENGEVDLAIMAFPYDAKSLKINEFYEERFVCAAPYAVFEKNVHITFGDLQEKDILLLDDGHCLRDHAMAACQLDQFSSDQTHKKTFSATSLQTILQMVSQGFGLTLLPQMMVDNFPIPEGVFLHQFVDPVPTRKIGVAWRASNPQIQNIKGVNEFLKNLLK